MISFIRSPTWITREIDEDLAANGRDTKYSKEEIERFKSDPQYFLEYRKSIHNSLGATFSVFFRDSEEQRVARAEFKEMMRARLKFDEELCEKIIPSFSVGCRR